MKRKIWLLPWSPSVPAVIWLSLFTILAISCAQASEEKFSRTLPIPPLLENTATATGAADFSLVATHGKSQLIPEFITPTMGFNGSYLGPTIRVRNGQHVDIDVKNNLNQDTTVHWHGLHVPAKYDGGPRQVIPASENWRPSFTIKQPAATLWYHPHLMGRTGEQVYKGMAGLFIIEDEVSDNLAIPKDYGVDDIPLIIQDRRFFKDGTLAYVQSMMDVMHGVIGNILLVNGVEMPSHEVVHGMVRLRLLNGSNASLYRLRFSGEKQFHQIATDGGFLEQPVELTEVLLSPGERAEILVDFSADKPGEKVVLIADMLPGGRYEAMQFVVGSTKGKAYSLPAKLTTIDWLFEEQAVTTRTFQMQTFSAGGRLTINNKHMELNRVDEKVLLGTTEIWEIENFSNHMMQMVHSMHLHDVQFQILDRDGKPPAANERGRKDTVLIAPNERVRIIARFEDYTGIYMYHCHILEHEDGGMMGQFEVVDGSL